MSSSSKPAPLKLKIKLPSFAKASPATQSSEPGAAQGKRKRDSEGLPGQAAGPGKPGKVAKTDHHPKARTSPATGPAAAQPGLPAARYSLGLCIWLKSMVTGSCSLIPAPAGVTALQHA